MLRITVHDEPRVLTFRLEGRLAGPWLRELEECWRSTLARRGEPILCVDLTGVTFVDAAGKACLAAVRRQGAEFVAADCLTRDVVAEIDQAAYREEGWQQLHQEAHDPASERIDEPEKTGPVQGDERKEGQR